MIDKELRKLSRLELLELLVAQSKQLEELQVALDEAEDKLSRRELKINKAGSIAEAVVSLSEVLEAAEDAGRMYVDELEKLYQREKVICINMEDQARLLTLDQGAVATDDEQQQQQQGTETKVG
jgi:hypothetical protein